MTIKDVHDRVLFRLNKHQSGYVSPEEIDRELDRAQLAEFHRLNGNEEEFQAGRPVPRIVYGLTTNIHAYLEPFKVRHNFISSNFSASNQDGTGPDGIIVLPSDAEYVLNSLYQSASNEPIDILNENQLAERLNSEIVAPTAAWPVAIFGGKTGTINGEDVTGRYKIQLFPEAGNDGHLYYLRRPKVPVFSYTLNGRTVTHDPNTSQDLEWNDMATEMIINRAVSGLSDYLERQNTVAYSESKIQRGV